MSSRPVPLLGTYAIYNPSSGSRSVDIDASTCRNLTLFKELMKEYRRIDDSVTMRLNRTVAMFRERERPGVSSQMASPEQEGCAYFWQDLTANWRRRTQIIEYCVQIVDASIEDKQKSIERESLSLEEIKETRKASLSEEVKRNQIHNELAVEAIIRRRSLDAFKSRCRYFEPPLNDVEARKWWDHASGKS